MTRYSLSKSEKLKSRTIITDLFAKGKSVFVYPIKLVYIPVSPQVESPCVAAFTVPKRQYKRATARNAIKRHLRESYRLAKPQLYKAIEQTAEGSSWALMYVYVGKKSEDVRLLDSAIRRINKKLLKEIVSQ